MTPVMQGFDHLSGRSGPRWSSPCYKTHAISRLLFLSPPHHPSTRPSSTNPPLPPHYFIMASTTNTTTSGGIIDTISNATSYVTESAKEVLSGASKESNKEIAKGHTDASLTDRASAGFSAASDKIDESSHGTKADYHKEVAKN